MPAWSAKDTLLAALAVIGTSLLLIYLWFKRTYSYWRRQGVVGPTPIIPFGNFAAVIKNKISIFEFLSGIYNKYKHERFFGIYMLHTPVLCVNEIDLANRILGADFSYFESHGPQVSESVDPLGVHLFNLAGQPWRDMRAKLSPAFTSGKMKGMFLIMEKIGDELQDAFKDLADQGLELDIQDLVARFTTDVIGNCAFGVDCNSLKDKDAAFRHYGSRVFKHEGLEGLKQAIGFFFPEICKFLRIRVDKKDVTRFIFATIRETVKYREENNVKRNDFLNILIEINKGTLKDDQGKTIDFGNTSAMTENEFMSQVFLFFVAGFETSSSTTSFALYELALNPDVQQKAREHVRAVLKKHNGKYTYDALMEMEYLANIINETLRKYPPLSMLFRQCTTTYKIPDSGLHIEKGTMVFVPIFGMQMDPDYFPEPEKFDPDRFNSENRHSQLNRTHMPFGQGPRVCLGQRFGIMQSKLALAKLLDKYSFSAGENIPIPMKFQPGFNMIAPEKGMWLKVSNSY